MLDKHKSRTLETRQNDRFEGIVYSMFTAGAEVIEYHARLAAAQAEIKQNA